MLDEAVQEISMSICVRAMRAKERQRKRTSSFCGVKCGELQAPESSDSLSGDFVEVTQMKQVKLSHRSNMAWHLS